MMRNLFKYGSTTALAAALAMSGTPTFASSHREAPFITRMSKVDNTDVYAFRSYEPGRQNYVTIIANFQPGENPGDGPNYYTMDPDAIYEISIDNVGDGAEHLTYQFKFMNTLKKGVGLQVNAGGTTNSIALRDLGNISKPGDANLGEDEQYSITQITGDRRAGTRAAVTLGTSGYTTFFKPFDNAGAKSVPNYPAYAGQFVYPITVPGCADTGGRVFVGQRAEAFAVNLGGVFDSVNLVPIEADSAPGAGDGKGFPGGISQSRANDELVGKKNVTSIAIELPISCITGGTAGNGTIGVWSSASLPQARLLDPVPNFATPDLLGGAYTQVSRLGNPLVNELVVGLPDKNKFNGSAPKNDAQFLAYVTNPTFPVILDALFRAPVNKTLGANIANLAPQNYPRNDLVAVFLTGIPTLNQLKTVTPSEMMRLNTAIAPTPQAQQSTLGVAAGDLAGYPNGRRPGDDAIDITLRVAMGALCYPVPVGAGGAPTNLGYCTPAQAPVGNVAFTDGAPISAMDVQNAFPYLNNPIPGSPGHPSRIAQ